VKELKETKSPQNSEQIVQDREYMMAACYWIDEYLSNRPHYWLTQSDPFFASEIILNKTINLPFKISPTAQAIKEIQNIIYSEFDFSIAKYRINHIVTNQ